MRAADAARGPYGPRSRASCRPIDRSPTGITAPRHSPNPIHGSPCARRAAQDHRIAGIGDIGLYAEVVAKGRLPRHDLSYCQDNRRTADCNAMTQPLPLPKYHQIYLVLRERLEDGRFAARVPAEMDLVKEFGVARVTV